MNLPNCAAAYPFVDGNGYWCARCGALIDECEPDCSHRTPRSTNPMPEGRTGA